MDAVKKLNENFLSCCICTERYTDPATLGCGHTFCKGCLANYSKSRQDAINAKSILCPNCRQMTRVPKPNKPVEEWPKQFKPHFLIQGLLDEFSGFGEGSQVTVTAAVKTDGTCFPCKQLGKSVTPRCLCQDCDIPLCEDCLKIHQSMSVSSHHNISDLDGDDKVKGMRMVICKEHKIPVEFYCKKCNKAICPKCGILYHGKCDTIVTIESMAGNMKSVGKQAKRSVMLQLETLQTNLALKQSLIESIGQNNASVKSEIKNLTLQAVDLIKQKEKRLMDELDKLTEEQTRQLRGHIKSGEIDLQMYQQYSEFIDRALRSESHMDLCDMYQMCQSGIVKCALDKETDVSSRWPVSNITLTERLDLQKVEKNIEIGRLKLNEGVGLQRTATECETIDIRTRGDRARPHRPDITVLDIEGTDTAVVTDRQNRKLKSFFTRGEQTRSSVWRVKTVPLAITKMSTNRVILCLSSCKDFLLVEVTPEFVPHSKITTCKQYDCLTAVNDITLAAGSEQPPSIDILRVVGQATTVIKHITNQSLIYEPWFLCTTTKGHIVVSDNVSKAVFCLKPDGDVVFTYAPVGERRLGRPNGIASTNTGHIFVVDHQKQKVIQLTEEGQFCSDILTSQDGLEKPYDICFHRDKLFITDLYESSIKVFCLQ